MKKIWNLVSILSFALLLISCPNITNPPSTSTTTSTTTTTIAISNIYIGGYLKNEVTGNISGYWKNNVWQKLQTPITNALAVISSIMKVGDDIYAVSEWQINEELSGYWKNGIWKNLIILNSSYNGFVSGYHSAIEASGNDIYIAGGIIEKTTDKCSPAFWKNNVLNTLSIKDGYESGQAESITVDGLDVYITGYIYNVTPYKDERGYWKNGIWNTLTHPLGRVSKCNSITIYEGDIYVQGSINNGTDYDIQGYWKNGTWISLTIPDISKYIHMASEICIENGNIYIAGLSTDKSNQYIRNVGYWKNGSWNALTFANSQDEGVNYVYDMAVSNNGTLYIAGYKDGKTGYWKNNDWNEIEEPAGTTESMAQCIFIY